MEKLEKLFNTIDAMKNETAETVNKVETEIREILYRAYDDWGLLQKAICELESGVKASYCTDESGDAVSYIRFSVLSDIAKREQNFLADYLVETSGLSVNFEYETLSMFRGSDEIYINDSGRKNDRGVYQTGKQIISEDEYLNEENEVDETVRNELIETHMEKTGYFPGVYRTDYYGNELYPVNTNNRKETK